MSFQYLTITGNKCLWTCEPQLASVSALCLSDLPFFSNFPGGDSAEFGWDKQLELLLTHILFGTACSLLCDFLLLQTLIKNTINHPSYGYEFIAYQSVPLMHNRPPQGSPTSWTETFSQNTHPSSTSPFVSARAWLGLLPSYWPCGGCMYDIDFYKVCRKRSDGRPRTVGQPQDKCENLLFAHARWFSRLRSAVLLRNRFFVVGLYKGPLETAHAIWSIRRLWAWDEVLR